METVDKVEAIPQPTPLPILENVLELEPKTPVQGLMKLAKEYGPIFRIAMPPPHPSFVVVSSRELVHELCDEKRFDKKMHESLKNIRDYLGDGLFTAYTDEPNWEKAHRILLPAFGPSSIRNMFDPMFDITEQMLIKWERMGDDYIINISDYMTRLTLDSIALCAFDYRFNSFYQHEMHPFVNAMIRALAESYAKVRRLPIQTRLMFLTQRRHMDDIHYLHKVADEVIAERKTNPNRGSKKDLLALMLSGRDPITGEGLSDDNIRYQMVTFLIAGHETTSGLLSFTLYFMMKNPEVLEKAYAEVKNVLGDNIPTFGDLSKLVYIDQILKETLRLWPTAPAFAVYPYEDTVVGGKYKIKKGESALILLPTLQRDPTVWGDDPEKFDPERFSSENYKKLPPDAWKPFGNGQRSCIGRSFAMQESILVISMILQRFILSEVDPNYQLEIKETLTLKPERFYLRAKRKPNEIHKKNPDVQNSVNTTSLATPIHTDLIPLTVLYGTNSGSSESFAQKIASDAVPHGFGSTLASLDEYVNKLPKEGAVIIVTATYEGEPPENAKKFSAWLDTLQPDSLNGVKYGVYGCGNRDWVKTYQNFSKRIDEKLQQAGAERIIPRGEGDARGDFFGDFDQWYNEFWGQIAKVFHKSIQNVTSTALYEIVDAEEIRPITLHQTDLHKGEIVKNIELAKAYSPDGEQYRHVEIILPEGVHYKAGDYLAVLPINNKINVERVLRRFGYDNESHIIIKKKSTSQTSLPTDYPINVSEVLANYVELAQPVTKKQIEMLVESTQCPPEKSKLRSLLDVETYKNDILAKRVSLIDLMERFASCILPFAIFLEMLPTMRTRQYSISSSPLLNPKRCTLTFSVLNAPAWSGQGEFKGVATNYLAGAPVGSKIAMTTRSSKDAFYLPENISVPVVMIAAGSGIAPFRGYIQERALQQIKDNMFLFFGCRHPDVDFLYKDELEKWQKEGFVKMFCTFSRNEGGYIQDTVWQERKLISDILDKKGKVYVCGDGRKVAPAVREMFIKIYLEKGASADEASKWMDDLEASGRYVTDAFY
jgi:cytochrome P450/NADPH-cytochrome P450 reductase